MRTVFLSGLDHDMDAKVDMDDLVGDMDPAGVDTDAMVGEGTDPAGIGAGNVNKKSRSSYDSRDGTSRLSF